MEDKGGETDKSDDNGDDKKKLDDQGDENFEVNCMALVPLKDKEDLTAINWFQFQSAAPYHKL